MFKSLIKYLFYVCLFLVSINLFLPKLNIYYFIENQLNKYEIVLSNEKINEKKFSIDIENVDVYLKNEKMATIETIHNEFLIYKNKINLEGLKIFNKNKNNLTNISIEHSVSTPLLIKIYSTNVSRKNIGRIDLFSRKVFFSEEKYFKYFQKLFSLETFIELNGEYVYEY